VQAYDCYEGDTVLFCCAKHLREMLQREGHDHIRIRRAWSYENIFMHR
jgi:hypothetical protein